MLASNSAAANVCRMLNATYMDALSLPSIQSMMRRRERLQPYIRTFFEVFASVPDGICWSSPYQNRALEAHVAFQVCSTTVLPILPSRHSCLYNCGSTPLLRRYCATASCVFTQPYRLRACHSRRVIGTESLFVAGQQCPHDPGILFANATAAIFLLRRSSSLLSQLVAGLVSENRITARAP